MQKLIVERPGDTDLRFIGEQVVRVSAPAEVSTQGTDWRTLYRTESGKYVLEWGRGDSRTQTSIVAARPLDGAPDVLDALREYNGEARTLTYVDKKLLREAALHDPAIDTVAFQDV